MIKKKHLSGVEVPDWYLERERELLEALVRLTEAKKASRTARNKMMCQMDSSGIHRIDSDLATVIYYDRQTDYKGNRRLCVRLR